MSKTDYPAESYRRLYDPGMGPLWNPEENLPLAEDGAHPQPDPKFFEWWYFDAALEDGHRLVIIFHTALFNITARPPVVDIRLTAPGQKAVVSVKAYPREQCRAAESHCDVRIGECRVSSGDGETYTLKIRQEAFRADLIFSRLVPGWKPGNGYLFADENSGRFFRWVVPLPVARVRGEIHTGGQTIAADGVGYHDHNWGNLHLSEAFDRWYWGRFISEDRRNALIFGDVIGRGPRPAHVRPLLLVVDGQIRPRQAFDIQYGGMMREPTTGITCPREIRIASQNGATAFRFALTPEETLEALHFAAPRFRHPKIRSLSEMLFYLTLSRPSINGIIRRVTGSTAYLRFQGRGSLELEAPRPLKCSGEAIYEIMDFTP